MPPLCPPPTVEGLATALLTLLPNFLKIPSEEKWKFIASQCNIKWNFPICLGAIDGKHIQMQAPPRSGSTYYNYKHQFSIVLLAVVDYNYKFILVDNGAPGKCSDAEVFNKSILGKSIINKKINIPNEGTLPVLRQQVASVLPP